jgi:hypothetical protein
MTSDTEIVLQIKNCCSKREGSYVIMTGYLKRNQVYFLQEEVLHLELLSMLVTTTAFIRTGCNV